MPRRRAPNRDLPMEDLGVACVYGALDAACARSAISRRWPAGPPVGGGGGGGRGTSIWPLWMSHWLKAGKSFGEASTAHTIFLVPTSASTASQSPFTYDCERM